MGSQVAWLLGQSGAGRGPGQQVDLRHPAAWGGRGWKPVAKGTHKLGEKVIVSSTARSEITVRDPSRIDRGREKESTPGNSTGELIGPVSLL
jgi:hypothetical protein